MGMVKYKNWKIEGLSGLQTITIVSWNRNRTETLAVSRAEQAIAARSENGSWNPGNQSRSHFLEPRVVMGPLLHYSWKKMGKKSCRQRGIGGRRWTHSPEVKNSLTTRWLSQWICDVLSVTLWRHPKFHFSGCSWIEGHGTQGAGNCKIHKLRATSPENVRREKK